MKFVSSAERLAAMMAWQAPVPERETFPEPLRTSREDSGGAPEVPGPVLGLQRAAEGAGWACVLTYAEGWEPHATTGRPGAAPKQSWALRMRRDGQRAVAVRTGAAWDSLWDWSADRFFRRSRTLAEFKETVIMMRGDGDG